MTTTTTEDYSYDDCTEDEFQCVTSGICIPKVSKCDQTTDCDDNSDEIGCQQGKKKKSN